MSTAVKIIVALGVVVVAALGGYYFFWPEAPVNVVDRLCAHVRGEQKMECVAVLAGDTVMKPGSIVNYFPGPEGDGRVTLPVADLFGESCAVPGGNTSALKKGLAAPQPISMPQFTYETNRRLEAGAKIEVPRLEGLNFEAGPNWSAVSKIELTTDEAWAITLDELSARQAFESCQIRTSCTDYINKRGYRVVGTAIVAKGLQYKVYNKQGDLLSAQVGAKAGQFTIKVGGKADVTSTADATIKSAEPRVVGVRFVPADLFTGAKPCEEAVVLAPPAGTASVSIVGGGGKGSIGMLQTASKPIGQMVELSATGSEASECNEGFERKHSRALAQARIDEDGPGAIRFTHRVAAEGGHYVSAAACAGGIVIGKTGHDTSATAAAEMKATIYILVRSSSSPPLRVQYSELPPGTRVQLLDWQNRPLQTIRYEEIKGDKIAKREDMPASVSGSGSHTLETRGAGQYRLEATFQLSASVTGNVNDAKESSGSVRVAIGQ